MRITPVNDAVGALVENVDLAKGLDDKSFSTIYEAWLERCFLLFRGQNLTRVQLTEFASKFGALEASPSDANESREDPGTASDKNIWIISNVIENGKAIGALGAGEAEWHSDMTYLTVPPTASVLYGYEVPPTGANTWFANMYLALEKMPDALRAKIEGCYALHNSSYTSAGELRKGMEEVTDLQNAPGCLHPLIINHPETHRPALFLGRRTNSYIQGLDLAESESLLDRLWRYSVGSNFVYSHEWQRGDVLIWDNRSTLHRRDAFDPAQRRILWRCQITGTSLPSAYAA